MIKRILYFGSPHYLSTREEQIIIRSTETGLEKIQPLEDIGYILLDHPQISISQVLAQKLCAANICLVWCNEQHLPAGMLLPLDAHYLQNERFRTQLDASEPLKKQLWRQTIMAKISNQGLLLNRLGIQDVTLDRLSRTVTSGDSTNCEAHAARHYWSKLIIPLMPDFYRDRIGPPPNQLLNWGYTVLRGAVARALVGAGLLPLLGIQHHNRHNAYCLADDMMEPYRPFVDLAVYELLQKDLRHTPPDQLEPVITREHKARLLAVLNTDTWHATVGKSPLQIALNRTMASLTKCFEGTQKTLHFPSVPLD
jgi:CRISP-associated protein Cas1